MRQDRRAFAVLLLLTLFWCGVTESAAQQDTGVTAQGRIMRAGNAMQIGTGATGVIAELLARQGNHVDKGQPLARLECNDQAKEVDAEKSMLGAEETALSRLEKGSRAEDIAAATANLVLAQAQADQTAAELKRVSPPSDTTSQAEIDKAQRDDKVAAARVEEARAKLAMLQAGSRTEDISEAKFLRDAAKARFDEAVARLERCTVRAPASGIVVETRVTLGQFISTAVPQVLFILFDSDRRGVRVEVNERDVGKICVGQHAAVTAPSVPGAPREGRVESVAEEDGERAISNGPLPGRDDADVRMVKLTLTDANLNWPIGLRVSVRFQPCAPSR